MEPTNLRRLSPLSPETTTFHPHHTVNSSLFETPELVYPEQASHGSIVMSAFTEENRKAFNDLAKNYHHKQWQIDLSNQVAEALQTRKYWLGVEWARPGDPPSKDIRLLDYACGTGAITKALGSEVRTIRGIDVSENMVEAFNEAARSSGLSEMAANAVVGDLCGAEVPAHLKGPEWYDFDVAVIGLGFHHFEDPALAVKRITERLKHETGVLCVVDFLPKWQEDLLNGQSQTNAPAAENPVHHHMSHTIKHDGFTNADMDRYFTAAGLTDFKFDVLAEPAVFDMPNGRRERRMFIARGSRSPTAWMKIQSWVGRVQDGISGQLSPQNHAVSVEGGGLSPQVRADGWKMVQSRQGSGMIPQTKPGGWNMMGPGH